MNRVIYGNKQTASPPSRRRGLKKAMGEDLDEWITVASFAEAWIENRLICPTILTRLSPPSRRRGLKNVDHLQCLIYSHVASFAEAWIEKISSLGFSEVSASPPSRRRGLKNETCFVVHIRPSRLLRGGVD